MSELVRPLKDFPDASQQASIGVILHTLVQRTYVTEHLRHRHLLGVIHRHGVESSGDESTAMMYKAYRMHNDGELGTFVLHGSAGTPIGLATIDPFASLKQQPHAYKPLAFGRIPQPFVLPPFAARGPFVRTREVPGPQVAAWVAPGSGNEGLEVLTEAYALLSDPAGPAKAWFDQFVSYEDASSPARAWTIEPKQSPDWIRSAIYGAGYRQVETGYFDDGESRRIPPPAAAYFEHQTLSLVGLDTTL